MENLFRKEVLKNKLHRLEGAISLVQPPIFHKLTLLILSIIIITVFFLAMGKYTRKERVSGVIEPSLGLLRLQAPQNGVISEVLVKEGEFVQSGQAILRIASAKHSKQTIELNQALLNQYSFQLNNLESQISQQLAKDSIDVTELEQERSNAIARLNELEQQSITFAQRLELNKKIVNQISTLKGSGYISELELQRQRDTFLSLKQQSSNIKSERLLISNQIKQFQSKLEKLPFEQSERLSLLESQKADLKMQLSSVEQQRLGELRAPQSGVVSGLLAKRGNAISVGQNLLTILPENSEMQAVVYVPTSAFGFVQTGQLTKLRYHAFPYERFGVYEGVIKEFSSSVILPDEINIPGLITEPVYRVVVSLKQQEIQAYGKSTELRAGMMMDADIVIEERSLLRWLFDPVFSIKGQL